MNFRPTAAVLKSARAGNSLCPFFWKFTLAPFSTLALFLYRLPFGGGGSRRARQLHSAIAAGRVPALDSRGTPARPRSAVDRREAHVRDLVDALELRHNPLADAARGQLALAGSAHLFHDVIDDRVDRVARTAACATRDRGRAQLAVAKGSRRPSFHRSPELQSRSERVERSAHCGHSRRRRTVSPSRSPRVDHAGVFVRQTAVHGSANQPYTGNARHCTVTFSRTARNHAVILGASSSRRSSREIDAVLRTIPRVVPQAFRGAGPR